MSLPQCGHGVWCNDETEFLNYLADIHEIRFESRKRQRAINSVALLPAYGIMRDISFVDVNIDEFRAHGAEISKPADGLHQLVENWLRLKK